MAKTIIITFCLSMNLYFFTFTWVKKLYFYQIFFKQVPLLLLKYRKCILLPPPKLHSGLLFEELLEKWSCQASSNSQHEWTSEQPDFSFSRWRGGDATRGPAGRSQSAGGLCEPLGSLAFQSCGTIPSQSHRLKMELGGLAPATPTSTRQICDVWVISPWGVIKYSEGVLWCVLDGDGTAPHTTCTLQGWTMSFN